MNSTKPALVVPVAPSHTSPSALAEEIRKRGVLQESAFVHVLRLERRRTERSGKPFMLVLLSCDDGSGHIDQTARQTMISAVTGCTRETDVLGWYDTDDVLGLLLTEIERVDAMAVNRIREKIAAALESVMLVEQYSRVKIVCQVFPEHVGKVSNNGSEAMLYPDLSVKHEARLTGRIVKRVMDVVGSVFALFALSPLFIVIAVLVKMTSAGPVVFCQERVGRYGRRFKFFKFRSMQVDNDSQIHEEYVAKLIAGGDGVRQADGSYKIVNDPRVTPLGRFLRKTSLDELPQFVNVLLGDMSLVGPRPPVPYEYQRYKTWHRRRASEIKPGLTGLWQVNGRSRTTFDEMVRMDLQYAKLWSLSLDMKLLLRTPAAILSGDGAR